MEPTASLEEEVGPRCRTEQNQEEAGPETRTATGTGREVHPASWEQGHLAQPRVGMGILALWGLGEREVRPARPKEPDACSPGRCGGAVPASRGFIL